MREVDPQFEDTNSEDRLTNALHHLAKSAQQGAPAAIGTSLAVAFRRHHTRRKQIRRISGAGFVASIVLMAGLLLHQAHHKLADTSQAQAPQAKATQARVEEESGVSVKAPDVVQVSASASEKPKRVIKQARPGVAQNRSTYSRQFLALPAYDPAVPADELHVVRAQVPASALWQMGAPVNPDGYGQKVMADFVVSQDGTPYAVRLIQ
jgi:hypothetical protein